MYTPLQKQELTIPSSDIETQTSELKAISWTNQLNTRFHLALVFILVSTFAIGQFLLLDKQKQDIYAEEIDRAAFMADGLTHSLQTLMLSGQASYATDWLARLSESPELKQVQVIRKDQHEAFHDTDTIKQVNRHLQSELFDRPHRAAQKITDIDSQAFNDALQGKKSSSLNEQAGELTFLLPVKSQEECTSCHGYDSSPVRGVLRITTSIAHAQARLDQARENTLLYGLLTLLIVGLMLNIFMRRNILKPLEDVTAATSEFAAGNLNSEIHIRRRDEIGMLASSFNHMTRELQQTTVSREYFESIMRSMGEMVFVTDDRQRIQFTNPAVLETLGYKQDELTNMHLDELIKSHTKFTDEEIKKLSINREIKSMEREFIHKSGHTVPVLITVTIMQQADNKSHQIVHAGRDITRLKRAEHELRLAAKVMECDSSAILICDHQSNILLVNPAFCEITGYSRDEVIGKNPRILSSGKQSPVFYRKMWESLRREGMWSGEIWNRRKNGELYPEWLAITAVRDDENEITNFVSIFTDISKQKEIERKLSHLAHHDQLTGLPNRTLFSDRLEHALEHALREKHKVGLMFIDIDGFKAVNDEYGHDVGDALLCIIANTLSDQTRDADTVARVGGDEFVIILENLSKIEDVTQVTDKILTCFNTPTMAAGIACNVGCSIGIALAPDDSHDADELVKKADTAMYLAKTSGKQQYKIYSRDCIKLKS